MNVNVESNFKHIEHENSNAVISFDNGTTFRISKFVKQLCYVFENTALAKFSGKLNEAGLGNIRNYGSTWSKGVDAEILEPQSGAWKKGKIRMRVILEFCPDEPEEIKDNASHNGNSLDDIRQTIQ